MDGELPVGATARPILECDERDAQHSQVWRETTHDSHAQVGFAEDNVAVRAYSLEKDLVRFQNELLIDDEDVALIDRGVCNMLNVYTRGQGGRTRTWNQDAMRPSIDERLSGGGQDRNQLPEIHIQDCTSPGCRRAHRSLVKQVAWRHPPRRNWLLNFRCKAALQALQHPAIVASSRDFCWGRLSS